MMEGNSRSVKIIDKIIFIFFILFLLSLTNSIFINQLGYYGALVFILIRYFLTRKNLFPKTGLELAFAWFILAEILSAIFSEYSSAAFHNVLKRALLIPIVYTTITAATDLKKGKLFFKIYIGASLISVLIYLYFAYQHYIQNLYGVTESGPSIFQYPITASEIMSFTIVYLFAFLVNEKLSIKNRLFIFLGFGLSLLALFSTYKRTGWLGAAFGIFVILIIKKQWKILIPLTVAGTILIFTQENISKVFIYDYDNGKLTRKIEVSTEGRAYNIHPEKDFYFLSDHENGLIKYRDSIPLSKYEFPAPIGELKKWKDEYYLGNLIDTRFVLLKKQNDSLFIQTILLSSGLTTSSLVANDYFYILDEDSGLTVYRDPALLENNIILEGLTGYTKILADSNYFILFSPDRELTLAVNEFDLPGKILTEYKHDMRINFLDYFDNKIFISDNNGLKIYNINDSTITLHSKSEKLKQIHLWEPSKGKLFAASLAGIIYEIEFPIKDSLKILGENNIGFSPSSINFRNEKLYATFVKRNRIASIWDPYHPSNTGRLSLWRAGWEMFKDHPVFGVGDIDLREYYMKYKQPHQKEIQGHMHNNFMHVLVTLGIFGFLAVLFLFWKIIAINFNIYNKVKNKNFVSSYALGTLGAIAAFLLAGMTELNFGDHEIITLVWFTIGLNIAFYFLNIQNNGAAHQVGNGKNHS
jgi:hypothetical protein